MAKVSQLILYLAAIVLMVSPDLTTYFVPAIAGVTVAFGVTEAVAFGDALGETDADGFAETDAEGLAETLADGLALILARAVGLEVKPDKSMVSLGVTV